MKNKLAFFILFVAFYGFSQSGETDPAFGINGKVITSFGTNRNSANAIVFQPDGKFIVGGSYISSHGETDFALARFNSDGSPDFTFGTAGKVVTDFLSSNNNISYILSLYVLPDGKIMALGTTGKVSFLPALAIARYTSDGNIDYSFGTNGKIISQLIPFDTYGDKLIFLPDGKFIVTSVKTYAADPNYYFGLERYTADGQLDTNFGTDGLAVTSFGNGKNFPASLALQPDGKIVVAGKYQQTTTPIVAVSRFTADGILDNGFDGDGKVLTTFGAGVNAQGMQVAVNPSGKIQVAGIIYGAPRNFMLIQYNANGSLDTAFDEDGKALAPFADIYESINSITKQADDKFLVVTKSDDLSLTTTNFTIRRYNADISVDMAFGLNGKATASLNTGINEAQAVVVLSDGKIMAVGKSIPLDYSHIDFAVAKYDANGTLDTSFNTDGKLTAAFEKGIDVLNRLLVQQDDKLIAVGTSGYRQSNNSTVKDIVLARYNSNGGLDTTFGNSGKVVSVFGQNVNYVSTAVLQPDGKILVSNSYYNVTIDSAYHYEIIRYNANGSLDTSFGTNGKVVISFNVGSIVVQPDGKIIAVGFDSSDLPTGGFMVYRLNVNGTPDTTFDTDGKAFVSLGNGYFGKISTLLQPDGKIIVSSAVANPDLYNGVSAFVTVRFTSTGSLDTSFGNNGKANTLVNDNCFASAAFLQPDGKILLAGTSFGSGIYFSSLRYDANGMLDATYGTNGVASTSLWFDYRLINDVCLQPDGKFLAALTKYNQPSNSYDFKIRRFNQDGTYDNDFGGSTGVTASFFNGYDEAFSIGLQSDYKIVVAGSTNNGINNDFALTRLTNEILSTPDFNTNASNVILYPNPVKNVLHIKLSDNNEFEIRECSVYNMLGQLIYKSSDKNQVIDTANFSPGIYAIQLKTDSGILGKKFIKE